MLRTTPIIVAMKDGSTSVLYFLTQGRGNALPDGAVWVNEGAGQWARPPRESMIAEEVKRSCPEYLAWHRVNPEDIPTDRTYRDAWHHDGETIAHDMAKAREIHRNKLRHERANVLVDLDGKWHRATGQGKKAEADAIEAQRQRWRDAPADPRIDAAQTVDDLKAIEAPNG
jgi:hypothetical protein